MSKTIFTALCRDERGATAIEYSLIAALIAIAAITAMGSIGNQIGNSLDNTAAIMAV